MPTTVFTLGSPAFVQHVQALCDDAGLYVAGSAASADSALPQIDALAVAPDLIIADIAVPHFDIGGQAWSLSERACSAHLLFVGACPRILDTLLILAASLGLPPSAAAPAPLTREALRDALAELGQARARPVPAPPRAPVRNPAEIRTALLRGEFTLYYQPQIELATGRLHGAEALLRWHHPQHGVLTPASFLPLAEDAGLVELLTAEVLQMALADIRAWRVRGHTVPVSVNLSPLALVLPDLADWMIAKVRASGLPPSAIAFEITEQTEIANLSIALRNLLKLRLAGHRLSLDDYGAGHGSILQLSRIPFSEVKADMRLVQGAWKRPHVGALLKQAVASARELDIACVAEGIESCKDWTFMRSLGFDVGQGYLIARPMPAHQLPAWRLSWACSPLPGVVPGQRAAGEG